MPHFKLTHFNLRGRAECIRMMFAIAGVPLEDVRVELRDWGNLIQSKATPFDALPVLDVDGVQIAQTKAILRYIARETGYAGADNLTAAVADAIADQFADFQTAFVPWHLVNIGIVPGDKDALYKSVYLPAKDKHLSYFEAALKQSSTGWYANTPELTHADVFIAAGIEWLARTTRTTSSGSTTTGVRPDDVLDGFPLMLAHFKKFFAHPKLQKHLAERGESALDKNVVVV